MGHTNNFSRNWSSAVALIELDDTIVFIKRSEEMPTHKGQIGFFGGGRQGDETPKETAIREFEEEGLLNSNILDFQGILPEVYTSNKKIIVPVHFKCTESCLLELIKSNGEWDYAFKVRKEYLLDRSNWTLGSINSKAVYTLRFCAVPNGNKYEVLWGATANMIWSFFKN